MATLAVIFPPFWIIPPVLGDEYNISNFEMFSGLDWHNCGSGNNWYPDTSLEHLNVLRSGPIECTGASSICRDVYGPTNVTFYWKSDTMNKDYAQLSFFVDDAKYICNNDNWEYMSYLIYGDGYHELKWEFRKIKCYPKNSGIGWIADVIIKANEPERNGYNSGSQISNRTHISPINTMLPSETSIESYNMTIKTNNITIIPSQVTISPTNLASIPDIRVSIIPKNERPTIELISPEDNSSALIDKQVQFWYKPTDDKALTNCSLFIENRNGAIKDMINSSNIYNGEANILNYSFDKIGKYRWCIECCDEVECSDHKHYYRHLSVIPETVYVDQNQIADGITYFRSISEAIRNVPDNATVIVEQGSYLENDIIIDKPIYLKGNRSILNNKPQISGSGPVILIKSDNVIIEGLNIKKIDGGGEGIRVKGGKNHYYKNISITDNDIQPHCIIGIFLDKCVDCNVSYNSINQTYEASMLLIGCINCSLFNNTINNRYPAYSDGTLRSCIELLDSININLTNNTLLNSPIGIWCYNTTITNKSTNLECKCRLNESGIWDFINANNHIECVTEHCRVYADDSK